MLHYDRHYLSVSACTPVSTGHAILVVRRARADLRRDPKGEVNLRAAARESSGSGCANVEEVCGSDDAPTCIDCAGVANDNAVVI